MHSNEALAVQAAFLFTSQHAGSGVPCQPPPVACPVGSKRGSEGLHK